MVVFFTLASFIRKKSPPLKLKSRSELKAPPKTSMKKRNSLILSYPSFFVLIICIPKISPMDLCVLKT